MYNVQCTMYNIQCSMYNVQLRALIRRTIFLNINNYNKYLVFILDSSLRWNDKRKLDSRIRGNDNFHGFQSR